MLGRSEQSDVSQAEVFSVFHIMVIHGGQLPPSFSDLGSASIPLATSLKRQQLHFRAPTS